VVKNNAAVDVSPSGAILMTPPRQEYTPMPAPITPSAASTAQRTPGAPQKRSRVSAYVGAIVAVLAIAGALAGSRMMRGRQRTSSPALRRGVVLWQQGQASSAGTEFMIAARELPASAMPHIYLSRIARERGDAETAFNEAATAAKLEPNNALALREVGAVLLSRGDNDAARRFFVRALKVNPTDHAAMGWLACSFNRMGYSDEAARWSQRAGAGDWSSCLR
jgi:Tfp pilus assembly protein PilF